MITVPHIYTNGPLYNLLADERGSFYKDIHGLARIIPFLPLDDGILELGSGWDTRGAELIKHETPGVPYFRDQYNFADLTVRNSLYPVHNRQYSCVTGLCYLLNALNKHTTFEPVGYEDLVTAMYNIRSVLTDEGAAVFGIYHENLLDTTAPHFKTSIEEYPNPFWIERLTGNRRADLLTYDLECSHDVHSRRMRMEWSNIKVGEAQYHIEKPLFTTVWKVETIVSAAYDAGFSGCQTFSVMMGEDRGYSSVTVDAGDPNKENSIPNVSHVLLYA